MDAFEKWVFKNLIFLMSLFLVVGCSPKPSHPVSSFTPSPIRKLTPFYTTTSRSTPLPPSQATATLRPAPSSTPQTHIIQRGETLGGIASKFGITIEALMNANPGINPRLLVVGNTLIIPPNNQSTQESFLPSATPVSLNLGAVRCIKNLEGGAWCFAEVTNPGKQAVDSISALIRITNHNTGEVTTKQVSTLLDHISPGQKLTLVGYFSSPFPEEIQANITLLTAFPATDVSRYPPIHMNNQQVEITDNGLSAIVRGDIQLDDRSAAANNVWASVTAYNNQGLIIGARRWQSNLPLAGGKTLSVQIPIYSTGEKIDKIAVALEAKP